MRKQTYQSFISMHQRCNNPNSQDFRHYGGRGITVCERWHLFANFLEDMGYKPAGLTLDRIDPNGNYCPENCRWATRLTQSRNRRDTVQYTHNGETKTLREWCEHFGVHFMTIYQRLRRGDTANLFRGQDGPSQLKNGALKKTRMLTYQGQTKPIIVWSRELGIPVTTIKNRLRRGHSDESAITSPRSSRLRNREQGSPG